MSPSALATRDVMPPPEAPMVTNEQLELVKRTVAQGATDAELKLFLFDCARQGVHPLDRLVHFTKRGGKYTPVTSIDFMRQRAAETGEMAGSDDPVFESGVPGEPPLWATVTVYRLTQGQRFAYTATARWSEYKPEQDFMWRKMPHTMLGKCAEALALRKGFPRQLAGLYAKEEMEQGETPVLYSVEAPTAPPANPTGGEREKPAAGTAETPSHNYHTVQNNNPPPPLPEGAVIIERVDAAPTKNKNVTKFRVTLSSGEVATTIKNQLAASCEQWCASQTPVLVEVKKTQWGLDLLSASPLALVPSNAELDAELARQEMAKQAGDVL